MSWKKITAIVIALGFMGVAAVATFVIITASNLPNIVTVEDYEPLLVSEVYDRNGKKIGEFFREKRMLIEHDQMPKHLVEAFIAAEDDSFYEHNGLNYIAIFRAAIANMKAGRRVQGASTITQQVARSLLLTSEKTYTRKIKEAILAYKMEDSLTKEEILYLYLNQIYLGQGAYGVGAAADIYFRKNVKDITVAEAALLAGLPQAPSRYSPIYNPSSAKVRQKYVLTRMADVGFISEEDAEKFKQAPLKIFVRKNYKEIAPYYLETVRQMLVERVGEEMVLDKGIKVYTSLDLEKQEAAQEALVKGLRELDKRQGYRGAETNIQDPKEIADFLLKSRNDLMDEHSPERILLADGTFDDTAGPLNLSGKDEKGEPLPTIPDYIKPHQIVNGIVTRVDDDHGLVYVRFAESKGLIDIDNMKWARSPDAETYSWRDQIEKPSEALKKGDVILVEVAEPKFDSPRLAKSKAKDLPDFKEYAELLLEQEPAAEASLISFDQETEDVVAMVGGYDFQRSEYNRTYQAARQTGSAFKSLVYMAALDKEYSPATPIVDAPIVYEEEIEAREGQNPDEVATKTWKPHNHSQSFGGDILFRNALIKSLNVPTVKIIEDIGVDWVSAYARRLGIFSPLNMDFTLALGSSSVTLYEITKVFGQIGRLGQRLSPALIHKVENKQGEVILEKVTLDERFQGELQKIEKDFEDKRLAYLQYKKQAESQDPEAIENASVTTADGKTLNIGKEPPLYFEDPNQLIDPKTAYVTSSLLQAVVEEGTGARARALGRPTAGKTGTTNNYYDGWFIGYTADFSTGVWVGFDEEKSLGRGEVGGRVALPIWVEYMKAAHEGLPVRNFPAPEGIVFANIDNKSGKLASAQSDEVIRQAFVEGTEPEQITNAPSTQEDQNFYKEELAE